MVESDQDPAMIPLVKQQNQLLAEAQAPLNWRQLGRLGLAIRPIDDLEDLTQEVINTN